MGRSPVDEALAALRDDGGDARLEGRGHAEQDETRVQVGLIQGVLVHPGREIPEVPEMARHGIQHVRAARIRAVLHVQPARVVGHVIDVR
ncbi:MAG TPA: hypothetical protein VKM54_08850 [Myxococcota bacterium]|nr:hypothetical protein [Myxococcota bacterium]